MRRVLLVNILLLFVILFVGDCKNDAIYDAIDNKVVEINDTISYQITKDNKEVLLNVYKDNYLIKSYVGNFENSDYLFEINNEKIYLSKLNMMNKNELNSLFGNLLHHLINGAMKALSCIEIRGFNYEKGNALEDLKNQETNRRYLKNYEINSSKMQPNDFVYGQHAYSDWYFDFNDISYAGCEVVAGYNLARAKGLNYSFSDAIFMFESLEIGMFNGYFGANPYQINRFLNALEIPYNMVVYHEQFAKIMSNDNDYYVILSMWNGTSADDMIHTFMIDKSENYSSKYRAYNYNCNESYEENKLTSDCDDYLEYFSGDIKNTFICAYFISR